MKKTLLCLSLTVMYCQFVFAQCVTTCSNYVASPITFSTFVTTGTDCISQFAPTIDDGVTPPVNIGFNFDFYCTTYTQVLVCSNGFIQFNINNPPSLGAGSNAAQAFPDPTSPNAIVALDMGDFDPNQGGTITYTTVGTAPNRMFIVSFNSVPFWKCSTIVNTGQIVLRETSNIIEIHTADVNSSFGACYAGTQGLENELGTRGTVVPGRSNNFWGATNSAYKFEQIGPVMPAAVSGSSVVCQGTSHQYSVAALPGAGYYDWTLPQGWGGSSSSNLINGTAGSSGNLSVTVTYTCGTSDPATLSVTSIPPPVVSITSATPAIVCSGQTFTVIPSGAATYTLNPGNVHSTVPFVVTATATSNYSLTGTDATGCVSGNTDVASILVLVSPTVTVNSGSICLGQSFLVQPSGADSYIYPTAFANITPTATGTFTYGITGTDVNGCNSPFPAVSTLSVYAVPVLTVSATRPILCQGEQQTSLITATGASSYSWSTGSLTNTLSVSPSSNTTYTVTGMSPEGCSKTKNITLYVTICIGIDEVAGQETAAVSVYPNPASGWVKLKFSSVQENASVEFFDGLGRLIATKRVDGPEMLLDLSQQASGIYYLKVKNGAGLETLKIVRE